jgi:succinoglycan biosynthesis protein ExoA
MAKESQLPFVTIAMPCLNEEHYIEACIASVRAQDYPRDRIEILVADGGSSDKTRSILARLHAEDPRITMIDNPAKIQAAGMNEMIRASKGDVIVRMDVHCEYAADYVRKCIEALDKSGADNVGGAQRSRATTRFQRALAAALQSPAGVGGVKYRGEENEGFVDTVFLGAFKRSILEKVGLYDPKAITNEDAELNQRIHDAGGRLYLSRDIVVHYFPRPSMRSLAKQYFKYGKGRARTLLKHGKFLSVRPAIPFGMVVGGALLVVTAPIQPFTPIVFGLYGSGTLFEALRVSRHAVRKDKNIVTRLFDRAIAVPTIWAIFPVLHGSHGVGFGLGLLHYAKNRDWSDQSEALAPRASDHDVKANGTSTKTNGASSSNPTPSSGASRG